MLSILHRYVLWELVRSFVISFAALVGMMLLGSLYKPLRLGVGPEELARLVPFMLPSLYGWVMPAALLSACVMAYGRLSADNELTAVCASGIPLRYMCYPALVLALLLTSLAVPLNDWMIPYSSLLREQEARRMFYKEPFRVSLLGTEVTTRLGGYKIYVESVDGDVLRNVVVIEPRTQSEDGRRAIGMDGSPDKKGHTRNVDEGSELNVYRAETGRYKLDPVRNRMKIILENAQCVMVLPGRSARQWVEIGAKEFEKEIRLEEGEAAVERRSSMTTSDLLRRSADLSRRVQGERGMKKGLEKEIARYVTEVRLRESLAFATLALCCVGVPIGMWMRRQSRLASFAIGIVVYLALYAMIAGAEGLAVEQRLPSWLALWAPDALMGALGIAALLRMFRH